MDYSGDGTDPVEIADRVYWVGANLPGDDFQCHAYLVECGSESVLIDPGSVLTWHETRRKIDQLVDFDDIRYFVCQHQDPDIAGALPTIDATVRRDDAVVVTDWRAAALLKHLALERLPFWLLDDHGWELDAAGRRLTFMLTPYLHFPGAFVTHDPATGTLFSSDLFGAFTEEWKLFADGIEHFEAMRPFHEHYMPSREILAHSIERIRQLRPTMIAPQHGSIIRQPLIEPIMDRLAELDCGLYMTVDEDADIHRLSRLNRLLRESLQTIAVHRDFADIATNLHQLIGELLSVTDIYYDITDGQQWWRYAQANGFRGQLLEGSVSHNGHPGQRVFELRTRDDVWLGVVVLTAGRGRLAGLDIERVLREIEAPLAVAVERELLTRALARSRQEFYDRSVRDALTGLYNRYYMHEAAPRLLATQRRHPDRTVWVTLLDIDRFKRVNDQLGHATGDRVLRAVGDAIARTCREGDLAIRLGGEEFVVVASDLESAEAHDLIERLRAACEEATDPIARVTLSAGLAAYRGDEDLGATLRRADAALYEAKRAGRDRVCVAP